MATTWTNAVGLGDGLASTATNWSGLAVPNNEDVTFDGTNTDDCTWDITNTQVSVLLDSAYTGTVTCTAAGNFGAFTFDATGMFDGNGQNLNFGSIDASGSATKTIDMGEGSWTVVGDANFNGANLTLIQPLPTSTGLLLSVSCTLSLVTGQTFYRIDIAGSQTYTLGSNVATINFYSSAGAGTCTIDGNTLQVTGELFTSTNIDGTTVISFEGGADGAAQQLSVTGGVVIHNDIVIDKLVPFTLVGTIKHTGDLTVIDGTVDPGTSSWHLTGTAQTYDTNPSPFICEFYDLVPSPGLVLTLPSPLVITNELTLPNSGASPVTVNGSSIELQGDLNAPSGSNNNLEGTSVLRFSGNTDQSWQGPDTAEIVNPIAINKGSGTLTIGTARIAGNFTYATGTVDASAATMQLVGTLNFAPGAISIFSVVARDGGVVTLTSNMTISGGVSAEAASSIDFGANTVNVTGSIGVSGGGTIDFGTSTVAFTGACDASPGFAFHNMTINSGAVLTLTNVLTYSVAGLFYSRGTVLSNLPATQAILTINGTQDVRNTTATDIDSSGGDEVSDPGGTLDNADNWVVPVSAGSISPFVLDFPFVIPVEDLMRYDQVVGDNIVVALGTSGTVGLTAAQGGPGIPTGALGALLTANDDLYLRFDAGTVSTGTFGMLLTEGQSHFLMGSQYNDVLSGIRGREKNSGADLMVTFVR